MSGLILLLLLFSCGGGGSAGSSSGGGGSQGTGGDISATVQGLQSGAKYFWKVSAENGAGQTAGSDTWTFNTK